MATKVLVKVVVSGIGGQGAKFAADFIGQLADATGYSINILPMYSAEMMGGPSYCQVCFVDEGLAPSGTLDEYGVVLAMHPVELLKFLPKIEKGGLLIYNSDAIPLTEEIKAAIAGRDLSRVIPVPAWKIAEQCGADIEKIPYVLGTNVILVGVYLACQELLPFETAREIVGTTGKHSAVVSAAKAKAAKMNTEMLDAARHFANNYLAAPKKE